MAQNRDYRDISKWGFFGLVRGEVVNNWQFADEKTGELLRGVKVIWLGVSESVRLRDDAQYELIEDGDVVEIECTMRPLRQGGFKPNRDGVLRMVNGEPVGKVATVEPAKPEPAKKD